MLLEDLEQLDNQAYLEFFLNLKGDDPFLKFITPENIYDLQKDFFSRVEESNFRELNNLRTITEKENFFDYINPEWEYSVRLKVKQFQSIINIFRKIKKDFFIDNETGKTAEQVKNIF